MYLDVTKSLPAKPECWSKNQRCSKEGLLHLNDYCIFVVNYEITNMNIALIGYGKMGKEIEKIAHSRGHKTPLIIDIDNPEDLTVENLQKCDVAIEFTIPSSAISNYMKCFEAGIPVVSGTTGWLDQKDLIFDTCKQKNGTFFYASNFSVGVNLFFELNKQLAKLMAPQKDYNAEMLEVHHTQKLDAPSGTAISLAEDLIDELPSVESWVNQSAESINQLGIISERRGDVPGIHTIKYESEVDYIEITHSAKSRKGFAFGAVLAAEYSKGKTGILTMKDLLNL